MHLFDRINYIWANYNDVKLISLKMMLLTNGVRMRAMEAFSAAFFAEVRAGPGWAVSMDAPGCTLECMECPQHRNSCPLLGEEL